jgi:exodeoxyribonuclease VII large subunit
LAGQKALAVEYAREQLSGAMQRCVTGYRPRVDQYKNRLIGASPSRRMERVAAELDATRRELTKLMQHHCRQAGEWCRQFALRLNESHPDKILQRGFSITTLENGDLLKSTASARPGIKLITRLADGSVISAVEAVNSGRGV